MSRLRDFGWAIRDRLGGTAVAVLLALGGLGAGVAGLVIALDAKDEAEEAASATAAQTPVPATTTRPGDASAQVEELNERVAAIEESVSQLRSEGLEATTPDATEGGEATTSEETPPPEVPELPEGVEIPGLEAPGSD